MNILTIHHGHNGSITVSKDNELIVHTELERFSKIRYGHDFTLSIVEKINKLNIYFDLIVVSIWHPDCIADVLFGLINKKENCKIVVEDQFQTKHHIYHAYCAAYNVNKDFDYIVVLDGSGKFNKDLQEENISIYDNNFNEVYKEYYTGNSVSLGWAYQIVNLALYNETFPCGKTMALSCYGSYDKNIEILKDQKFNKKYFKKHLGRKKDDVYLAKDWIPGLSDLKDNKKALDFVHTFQKGCEEYVFDIFKRFENKKIIFTGGVAQNVLINTRLNNETSNTVYLDPMSADHGISLGMNVFYSNNKLKKRNTYYLGFKPEYDLVDDIFSVNKHTIKESNEEEVARILKEDVVAIFQGGSEQGQRGLGNRSLLINAEHENCIEKINKIKKREWYRPFACSILNEDLDEWFETDNKKVPYYMMFVYKAKKKVSNIVSVENTCRLQAVKKEHNKNYYNLINKFKKQTKLPYILNTSLNLPGAVLVEDLFDLHTVFDSSDLKYIWLPDVRKLIIKNGC